MLVLIFLLDRNQVTAARKVAGLHIQFLSKSKLVKERQVTPDDHQPVAEALGFPSNMFSLAAAGAVSRASTDTDVPVVLKPDIDQQHPNFNAFSSVHAVL